jgi:DHA2 family multidrug resistance protein
MTMVIGLSELPTVLEESAKDEVASPFILRLTIVALVSLAAFVWIESKFKGR